MNDLLGWIGMSWQVFRLLGVSFRVNLWLLIGVALFAVQAVRSFGPAILPAALLIPIASMLLHGLAHVLTLLWVRSQVAESTASLLVDHTPAFVPPRPWPFFAVGLSGPVANGLLALLGWWAADRLQGLAGAACLVLFQVNAAIAAFNCLACSPFDGQRFWRGLLWPLVGLRRACGGAIALAYLSAGGLLFLGAAGGDMLFFLFGLICLFSTIKDHRLFQQGADPMLELVPQRPVPTLWERWSERRAEARAARAARAEEAEQARLDALLAKVSASGLASLSDGERSELNRISRSRKDRQAR